MYESAATQASPRVAFILGIVIALGFAWIWLTHIKPHTCSECQNRHRERYCPNCGERRDEPLERNVHKIANRYPRVPTADEDRDETGDA